MGRGDYSRPPGRLPLLQQGLVTVVAPGPGVAEPERRQDMEGGRLRSAIRRRDPYEDIFGRLLGIFDEDIEIPILVEDSCVEEFVFHLMAAPPAVGLQEIAIWEGRLRILIEILHVGVGRRI